MKRAQASALESALHVLRGSVRDQVRLPPDAWDDFATDYIAAAADAEGHGFVGDAESPAFLAVELLFGGHEHPSPRILRARLALTIRALLRAERGDEAGWACVVGVRADGTEDLDWFGACETMTGALGCVDVYESGAHLGPGEEDPPFVRIYARLARPLWVMPEVP